MPLEELQEQACYDVLHAFLAESPALSSDRISIVQELLDECNIGHNAHIEIDDDKIKTDPLREEPEPIPLPPGFKFRPTDCEMANLFLKKKALGLPKPLGTRTIPVQSYDLFSKHPRDLPGYPKEKHWYFYCRKPTTNPKSLWTRVGEDTTVFDRQENGVGIKRSFTLIEEEEEESSDIYLPDEEEPPKEELFMDEISLLPTVADTDLVMCHVIRKKKKKEEKEQEEEEEEEEEEESVEEESVVEESEEEEEDESVDFESDVESD